MKQKYEIGFEFEDEEGRVYKITDYNKLQADNEQKYEYSIKNGWKCPRYRVTEEEFEIALKNIEERKQEKLAIEQAFNAPETPFVYELEFRFTPYKGKNWIAKITGTDPKYKLRREFIKPSIDHKKNGGYDLFKLTESGFYEYSSDGDKTSVCIPKEGFFEIRNGIRKDVDYRTVLEAMETQ